MCNPQRPALLRGSTYEVHAIRPGSPPGGSCRRARGQWPDNGDLLRAVGIAEVLPDGGRGVPPPLGLTPSRLGADAVQQTSSSSHRQASSTSPTPGGPSLLSCNRPSLDQAHGHDDGWKPASSGRPSTWDAMSATTAAPMYPGVVRPTLRHWLEKARTARPCSRCAPAHISTETNPAAGTGPEPTSSKAARHPGGHPAPCADLPDHTLSISHARRALMGIHGK